MDAVRLVGRAPLKTVHTRDLARAYAYPEKSLGDLERRGIVHKIAHGYYCLVPPEAQPSTWMPDLEAAAAGIATAIWGEGVPVLMNLSAARMHGALPRALGAATVAVPEQRRTITLRDREATIRFVVRNVNVLDAVRVQTELGPTLATSPAQTALDLARDPQLLQLPDLISTLKAVLALTDVDEVAEIAATQGRTKAALARLVQVASS